MTKKKLMEFLSGVPDDTLVIVQKDSEGNGYSPLYGVVDDFYVADNGWSGEVTSDPGDGVPCIVLIPTN